MPQAEILLHQETRILKSAMARKTASAGKRPAGCRIALLNRDTLTAAEEYETGYHYHPLIVNPVWSDSAAGLQQLLSRSTLAVSLDAALHPEADRNAYFPHFPDNSCGIIYSPHVAVYRDRLFCLRSSPYMVSVVTADLKACRCDLKEAVRVLLLSAAEQRYETLMIDLSECISPGSTPADPADAAKTAGCFYRILIEDHYADIFRQIIFSIPGQDKDSVRTMKCFADIFGNFLRLDGMPPEFYENGSQKNTFKTNPVKNAGIFSP